MNIHLITRSGKKAPLTHEEMDRNWLTIANDLNLKTQQITDLTDKLQALDKDQKILESSPHSTEQPKDQLLEKCQDTAKSDVESDKELSDISHHNIDSDTNLSKELYNKANTEIESGQLVLDKWRAEILHNTLIIKYTGKTVCEYTDKSQNLTNIQHEIELIDNINNFKADNTLKIVFSKYDKRFYARSIRNDMKLSLLQYDQ